MIHNGQLTGDLITIVIPTSPIPSHPSTNKIMETIGSLRHELPYCRIIIQVDGVRPEQEHLRSAYEAYKQDLLRGLEFDHLVGFQVFKEFRHQASMMRSTMHQIKTPLLMYVEHDLPLWPGPIDFEGIAKVLSGDQIKLIRLHYWDHILPEHQEMMLDREETPLVIEGVPLVRTIQYSQHPHIAKVGFYHDILSMFSPDCRTMIETKVYGAVLNAGWEAYRCAIYAPKVPNMKRVWHSNGRELESKYEDRFIF